MQLHLKRNETSSGLGGKKYDLFAQLELSPEEQERLRKSKPHKMFLWEDETGASQTRWRLCLIPGAILALISAALLLVLLFGLPYVMFFLPVAAILWIPCTKLIFNQFRPSISVADIITGRTIHCKSMDELTVKENAIREQLQNLHNYISGMRPTTGEGETVVFD